MNPIIVDMKDMSDSTEVYESRPNRFLVYTIYAILLLVVVAFLWMYFAKMDVVVKSDGVFRGNDSIYEISSGVNGRVTESCVEDGQYVEEGEILYRLEIDSLSDTIVRYQDNLEAAKDRLAMLAAYEESLEGEAEVLQAFAKNPYYTEFVNRRTLLLTNIEAAKENTKGQEALYEENIETITETLADYHTKIDKLNTAKQCVVERVNSFDVKESYYYSMVSSYIASYNYMLLQYNNQLMEYQSQIDEYNELLQMAGDVTVSGNHAVDVNTLQKQLDEVNNTAKAVTNERNQALYQLELQQVSAIEQQITSLKEAISSLEANRTSAKLQLESSRGVDEEVRENIALLTEKANIAAEVLNYQGKKEECEGYLKSYDIQNDNCTVKANAAGYFYAVQDLKQGSYVQAGGAIGKIYPKQESKYYALVYLRNADVAKVQVGQNVKFEIAAYPSGEYGYFTGTVESIAKDITVDQSTGYSYYPVKVACDEMTIENKAGEEVFLMNGMACQAKIIVEEENVLRYLLKKIDLLD